MAVFQPRATNYRNIGDVQPALYLSEMQRKGSPLEMRQNYQAIWESAAPCSALCLAQGLVESQLGTTGNVINPALDRNFLGLRPWEQDPTRSHDVPIYDYLSRADTGLTMRVHSEIVGVTRKASGSGWSYSAMFVSFAACAREWRRRMTDSAYKNGVYAGAVTLEDMLNIYAPASDGNDPAAYAATLRSLLDNWYAIGAGYTGTTPPPGGGGTGMTKPAIILRAGHRDASGGNQTEANLTDDLAVAYDKAFKAEGFTCVWYNRDVDGDDLPTSSRGDLSSVALGIKNWIAGRSEPLTVMFDLHFNGATSPVHAIVPDCVGLTSGFVGGAPADDTAANNTLDYALCAALAQGIANANGLSYLTGRFGHNGVMSERDTGVAIQYGARLGIFGGTAPVRAKSVRTVVEHGGTNDASKPDFFNRCAKAAVAAVKATIPGAGDAGTTPPPPDPDPAPDPGIVYPAGFTLAVAQRLFGQVGIYHYQEGGVISTAWRNNWAATGKAPQLVKVWSDASGFPKYFQFSDGLIIYQLTQGSTPVVQGPWTP